MSKSEIDERLVRRIAKTYIEKYGNEGFEVAKEYASRLMEDEPELAERVREEVVELLNPWR
jgi:hypothetical protein